MASRQLLKTKEDVLRAFKEHVSPHKGAFYEKYRMKYVMGEREGCYLYDERDEGVEDPPHGLLNLHCNGGVFNLGHRHPAMIEEVQKALQYYDIGNHHLVSRARAELGLRLAQLSPGDLKWTIFGVSGGEAIDLAIKMAWGYTGRRKIIVAEGAYHGNTGLSVLAGDKRFLDPFGMSQQRDIFIRVPFGDVEAAVNAIDDETAAVMMETVPATLGMPIPPQNYFHEIRRACNKVGAQLIIDEVQTGMGRSGGGKLWAIDHFGVVPDMMVVGKGLSGGVYPMSVTMFREHLAVLYESEPFAHVSTFGGSEVGCRVTLSLLEKTAEPAFLSHVQELAEEWKRELEQLRIRNPDTVKEIRQLGLFMGLRLRGEGWGRVMTKACFDEGVLLVFAANDTSVVQVLPPLIMPVEDVHGAVLKIERALKSASKLVPIYEAIKTAEKWVPGLGKKAHYRPDSGLSRSSNRTSPSSWGWIAISLLVLYVSISWNLFSGISGALPDVTLTIGLHSIFNITVYILPVIAFFFTLFLVPRFFTWILNNDTSVAPRPNGPGLPEVDAPAAVFENIEDEVQQALRKGTTDTDLPILGYGEITVVLKLPVGNRTIAVKRLAANFLSLEEVAEYSSGVRQYVEALEKTGVKSIHTTCRHVRQPDGKYAIYLAQEMIPSQLLLQNVLKNCSLEEAKEHFRKICKLIVATVPHDGLMGLDSQVANWYLEEDGSMGYLDISTPFMRHPNGRQVMNFEAFIVTFPIGIRQLARLILLESTIGHYHQPRHCILDLLGNLYKEKLHHLINPLLEVANAEFSEVVNPPLTRKEVDSYYWQDALFYDLLQRSRKVERWVTEKLLRRTYPYLLPPTMER